MKGDAYPLLNVDCQPCFYLVSIRFAIWKQKNKSQNKNATKISF